MKNSGKFFAGVAFGVVFSLLLTCGLIFAAVGTDGVKSGLSALTGGSAAGSVQATALPRVEVPEDVEKAQGAASEEAAPDTAEKTADAGEVDGNAQMSDSNGADTVTAQAAKTETSTIDWDMVVDKGQLLEMCIDKYYLEDINAEDMTESLYKGMINGLGDPYTIYYTAEEYSDFNESSDGSYVGIGVLVQQDAITKTITIVQAFKNSPNYSKLKSGDIIIAVDGEDVIGMDIDLVVSRIRSGKEGTKVKLTVIRDGEEKVLNLKRAAVEVDTVEYEMIDTTNKIGYIKIVEFDGVTSTQFKKALDSLTKSGMKGLIVDLRNNPGGRVDIVCEILDRMLPEGLIVYTEDKYGNRLEETSSAKESFDQPLAVLVNGNSASAAEIFAGAIQDYALGDVIGTTTFGKGIVQSIIPFTDGSALKVTIEKYYSPLGRNFQGTGIEPDIKVELSETAKSAETLTKKNDNQLKRAIKNVRKKVKALNQ